MRETRSRPSDSRSSPVAWARMASDCNLLHGNHRLLLDDLLDASARESSFRPGVDEYHGGLARGDPIPCRTASNDPCGPKFGSKVGATIPRRHSINDFSCIVKPDWHDFVEVDFPFGHSVVSCCLRHF